MLCTSFEETYVPDGTAQTSSACRTLRSACTRSGQGKDSGALPWGLYKGKQRQVMAPPGNVEATEGQSDSGGPREQSFRGSAAARQKLDQRSERTATERFYWQVALASRRATNPRRVSSPVLVLRLINSAINRLCLLLQRRWALAGTISCRRHTLTRLFENASDRHRVATIELVGLEEKHTVY
ncbi:hypothetical protein T11_12769 [Trichinella zimbabwensis]|uniref:Uncharacterized protein n=1 Tax=Trichinella zimbabwensis TaxID=268475 RepID=A0A0V1HWH1_9BILA|nr:hypothetical protein T11_12769 [Trichinella zimbabwensis]